MTDNVECLWQDDKAIVAGKQELFDLVGLDTRHHGANADLDDYCDDDDDDDCSVYSEELTWRLDPSVSLSDWTVQVVVQGTHPTPSTSLINGVGSSGSSSGGAGGSSDQQHYGGSTSLPVRTPPRSNTRREKYTDRVSSDVEFVNSVPSPVAATAVAAGNRPPVQTYHVHKSVLAFGPRRSNYFAREFSPKKSTPKRSRIQQAMQSSPTAVAAAVAVSVATADYDVNDNGFEPCDFFQEGMSQAARISKEIKPAIQQQWPLQQQQQQHPQQTSRLTLHPVMADAFAVLLDYLYSSVGNLEITTSTAVGLASLAERLEIKSLKRLCKEFYAQDMTMTNVCTYYHHAVALQQDVILQAAEDHVASHIFHVHETAVVEILRQVDSDFFLRCITHDKIGTGESASLRLSLLIAVYGNLHKHVLDSSQFYKLTAASHLPAIEVKAAKVLLELEDEICADKRNPRRVSSLQERCVNVLSTNWDNACVDPADVSRVSLPRLQGLALQDFVAESFSNAKARLIKVEQERDALTKRCQESEQDVTDTHVELRAELQDAKAKIRLQQNKIDRYVQKELDLIPKMSPTAKSKLTARYEQALEN